MASVLFVSHDDDLRDVAARVLRNAGWPVIAVPHGGHAVLACMGGWTFDVLVVEERMPGEHGTTLLRRLRRFCPHVQVVYMCDRRPASEGGSVVRPFTADDLTQAVLEAAASALADA
jgi:CheY-like chemotaxis protein